MATVTRTFMVDDIDGSQDDVGTVQFALDNVSYEIDLSTANAARLREGLARFVENGKKMKHPQGRKATSRRGVPPSPWGREPARAVREWARNNGVRRGDMWRGFAELFD
jgi:hypothetical protein